MTYAEAMALLYERGRRAAALEASLAAAYAALGVRRGIDVLLPPNSWTRDVRGERKLIELRRPWVALVERDGYPLDRSWIVAGDTRDDVVRRVPRPRPGPNGPRDSVVWLRRGPLNGPSDSAVWLRRGAS